MGSAVFRQGNGRQGKGRWFTPVDAAANIDAGALCVEPEVRGPAFD